MSQHLEKKQKKTLSWQIKLISTSYIDSETILTTISLCNDEITQISIQSNVDNILKDFVENAMLMMLCRNDKT